MVQRKPIYDDDAPAVTAKPLPSTSATRTEPSTQASPSAQSPAAPTSSSPSSTETQQQQQQQQPRGWTFNFLGSAAPVSNIPDPTDRLSQEIRRARLFLYRHSFNAENGVNNVLTRTLNTEARISNAIHSLAPAPESGERLLPGSIYVVVSGMGGSILARNRGLFLRTTTPLAISAVAASALLPVTVQNVGRLVYEYEKRIPGLAEKHAAVQERAQKIYHTSIEHSAMTAGMLEQKIGDGRKTVEEWLKKGN